MLRKLVTSFGIAIAAAGAVALAPGLTASADTSTHEVSAQATWAYVKWYQGTNRYVRLVCESEGRQSYPGKPVDCRIAGNTTQLWVKF